MFTHCAPFKCTGIVFTMYTNVGVKSTQLTLWLERLAV